VADSSEAPTAPTTAKARAIEVFGFKPTLWVCEHNRVARASMAPNNGHLHEELGWITCVAWKKATKRREEMKRKEKTKAQRIAAKVQCTEAKSRVQAHSEGVRTQPGRTHFIC